MKLLLTTIFISLTLTNNVLSFLLDDATGKFEDGRVESGRFTRSISTTMKHRDVLFLLDESTSSTNFEVMKKFVQALTTSFCGRIEVAYDKTRIATMTFSPEPRIHFGFDDSFNRYDIVSKLGNLPHKGGTTCKPFEDAIDMFTQKSYGSRSNAERLLILVSDGCFNCDPIKLLNLKKKFTDEDICFKAFLIGVQDNCVKKLKDLHSRAQCSDVYRLKDWNEFKTMSDYISKSSCLDKWSSMER